MTYKSVDIDSGAVSEWKTGVFSDGTLDSNWVDAIATVDYSFDQSLGVYNVSSVRVATVPEPSSLLCWFGLGLMFRLRSQITKKRRLSRVGA